MYKSWVGLLVLLLGSQLCLRAWGASNSPTPFQSLSPRASLVAASASASWGTSLPPLTTMSPSRSVGRSFAFSPSPPSSGGLFTHSPSHTPHPGAASRSPSHSPRPTPSVSRTPGHSIAGFYNHSGHITVVVDDFSAGTWQHVGWHTPHGQQLTSNYQAPQPCGETVLGCSRTLAIQSNASASTMVTLGGATIMPHVLYAPEGSCWLIPAQSASSGDSLTTQLTLQYDGDDDPNSLNLRGLGGVDLTAEGRSQALVYSLFGVYHSVRSVELQFYDMQGRQCSGQMPATTKCAFYLPQTFFLHHLSGECDMTQVGAFQMLVVPGTGQDAVGLGRIQLVDFVHPEWLSGGARC